MAAWALSKAGKSEPLVQELARQSPVSGHSQGWLCEAALPLIKGNDAMMGPALFYLGVANYNLAKMTLDRRKMMDAYNFSDQSSRINSPYAQQAWHNAATMKTEAERMR